MKYTAKQYAQALFEALSESKPDHHEQVLDNFAALLKERGDLGKFAEIEIVFAEYEKTSRGIKSAEITTARELTDREEIGVINQLNDFLATNVELKKRIDKGILGGVVVRLEDKLIDGSIKRNLQDLKNNLST